MFSGLVIANLVSIIYAGDVSLCSPCVSLMNISLDDLITLVMNDYIVGGCSEICSYEKREIEKQTCRLLCDKVGAEVFIEALKHADLDPIYYCQLISLCPHENGGSASIINNSVSPTDGHIGSIFEIHVKFNVTSETGTGERVLSINTSEGKEVLTQTKLNEGYSVGEYSFTLSVETYKDFSVGDYQVDVTLCEGQCGAHHEWTKVLDTATSYFKITSKEHN